MSQKSSYQLKISSNALALEQLTRPPRGRSSSRVTSRHFDHGNGSRAFTFKLFRSG